MPDSSDRRPLGEPRPAGGVWESDRDDIMRFASEGMAAIAGVPAEALVGVHVLQGFAEETLEEFRPLYEQAKVTLLPVHYDRISVVTPAGRQTYQSGWLVPRTDADGAYNGIVCTVDDVTSTLAAERNLVDSTARYRALTEFSPVGVFEADTDCGCRFVNPLWQELTGMSPEQAKGDGWIQALHPDDREWLGEGWKSFCENGAAFDEEYRFVRPDGSVVWVWGKATRIKDDAGATTGFIGVVTDITERRAIASDLQRQRQLAEQYLDIADMMLVVLDADGTITKINPKAEGLLATPGQRLLGENWFECCVPEEARDEVREVLASMFSGANPAAEQHENAVMLVDGEQRMIDWHNSTVEDESGDVVGVLALGVDVTAIREAEAMRQESLQKDRFLANMSHELRTPLNSIIGFSGTLLQQLAGPLTEEQRKQLEMIRNSGKNLLDLVEDLLDVERIAAGGVKLSRSTFVWADLIRAVADQARPQIAAKGLRLETDLCTCSAVVFSDERRVRQIVLNLISNAIKFTSDGAISVETDCTADDVMVRVRDTGMGVASGELDRIFELYHQAPRSDVAKSKGAGLGLPLSRSYANLLGGDLTVESMQGEGSVFTLTIPIHPPTDA